MADLTRGVVRHWAELFAGGPDVHGACRQCQAQMVLGPMAEATVLCHGCAQMFIADCAGSLLDMASRCVSEETLRKLARVALVTGNPLGADTVECTVMMKNLAAVISDLTDAAEALRAAETRGDKP